jgi:hypothetical protein
MAAAWLAKNAPLDGPRYFCSPVAFRVTRLMLGASFSACCEIAAVGELGSSAIAGVVRVAVGLSMVSAETL